MDCINLKERFGDRFKVVYEGSYYAQYGPNARTEETMLCRYYEFRPWIRQDHCCWG